MKRLFALALAWVSVAAFAQITYTDYSGSITTGGTSQTLAPASNGRVRIAILNPATETENLCVNLTSAASCTPGSSWILQSGQSVVIDSTEAVTVVAATTGHKWIAKAGVGPGFAANGGGSGSGGGGGAVTVADGADVTQGAKADAVCGTATGTCTEIALLKFLNQTASASNVQLVSGMGTLSTANSSSITISTSDAGPVAAGAATATRGIVPVGTYNSTPITVTNTQQAGFQIDANGYLKTSPATALPAGSAVIGKVSIDQTTPGTTDSVTVKGNAADVAVTLTRTADVNAYAANDVMGAATGSTAALTFTNLCPVSGGAIMITSASFEHDASALISGETSFVLHLYNVTPPSALGDNAAFDLPSGDRASYLGSINLGTPVDLGSTLYVATDGINKQIRCSGTNIYGYLVTVGAYTPASAAVYVVTLHSVGL